MAGIAESNVEELALEWVEELGWTVKDGPDIAPDEPAAERESYSHVILRERLECAIDSLNPTLPAQAKQEALRKALRNYTEGIGPEDITYDQREAVAIMLEKLEICQSFFHGFDYMPYLKGSRQEKLHFAPFAEEHIIQQGAEVDGIREHGLGDARPHVVSPGMVPVRYQVQASRGVRDLSRRGGRMNKATSVLATMFLAMISEINELAGGRNEP